MEGSRFNRRTFVRAGALGASVLAGCASSAPAKTTASDSSRSAAARTPQPQGPPTAAQWAALRRSLSGELVLPANAAYAQSRLVYDLRFEDAAPAAIAYAASAADVQRLIDFARRHAIEPIPRCGGHSYAGYSTGSGLLIDVARLNTVSVAGSTATVGAGTRLVDLYSSLAGAGVLVPGGTCPTVGIAGLALGGGVGVV
ncbi:MAG: FAD-binding protein, partial [Solirubrobacteraceae bacterium]